MAQLHQRRRVSQASPGGWRTHATETEVWNEPEGPYLDSKLASRTPIVQWFHQRRFIALSLVISGLLVYRVACGRTIESLVLNLFDLFDEFFIGVKTSAMIMCFCLASSWVATRLFIPTWIAFGIHLALFTANTVISSYILTTERTAVGSSLTVGMFWAMINLKTHSFFASHRITKHSAPHLPASILPSFDSQSFRTQPVSFLSWLSQPSLVYVRHPPRLPARRLWRGVCEFTAATASVLLVHLMHTEFIGQALARYDFGVRQWVALAVPAHVSVLMLFYGFFHCGCNFMAEMTRYADRTGFYGPFWDEVLVGSYFRDWSMPVHLWLRKHCVEDISMALSPNAKPPPSPRTPMAPISIVKLDAVFASNTPTTVSSTNDGANSAVEAAETPVSAGRPLSPPGHDEQQQQQQSAAFTETTRHQPALIQPTAVHESHRRRPNAFAYTFASMMAFAASSFFHEQIAYMSMHTFTKPYTSLGLFAVSLFMMLERWFGVALPKNVFRVGWFIGHGMLYLAIGPAIATAVQQFP
eukprot:TRINITY_DN7897_c0_g1_i1.p1 TRINITY_DN7897_c0_g1~~TRINITY_DN7897_c0_g1_i1.p1  ORF type:complete len:558 (-),score=88.51 TRINITY_DN7897_c0_g1_i1:42-1622(-)